MKMLTENTMHPLLQLFKMASHLQGHKPGDVISIHQSPHQQLSVVCQSRLQCDTAAVILSNVKKILSKWSSFIAFINMLAPKPSNSHRFKQVLPKSFGKSVLLSQNYATKSPLVTTKCLKFTPKLPLPFDDHHPI